MAHVPTELLEEAETAGIVPGTTIFTTVAGTQANILRQTFDPPIPLRRE